MTKTLRRLARDRSGATAIEYGLIAAFIALAIAGTLPFIKTALNTTFEGVQHKLEDANKPPA